jgi:hypothetical protein
MLSLRNSITGGRVLVAAEPFIRRALAVFA